MKSKAVVKSSTRAHCACFAKSERLYFGNKNSLSAHLFHGHISFFYLVLIFFCFYSCLMLGLEINHGLPPALHLLLEPLYLYSVRAASFECLSINLKYLARMRNCCWSLVVRSRDSVGMFTNHRLSLKFLMWGRIKMLLNHFDSFNQRCKVSEVVLAASLRLLGF